MTDPQARARALLAQASVLSEAKAVNMAEPTSHGKPDSGDGPQGESFGLYEAMVRRFKKCRTGGQLLEQIAWAERALRDVRYSRRPNVDCQTREGRLQVGSDERDIEIVAHVYGYSVSHIYRLRAEARKLERQLDRAA